MAEDILVGGTYGEETKIQNQISQGGVDITPLKKQEQQYVAPALQSIDAFNTGTQNPSEPTLTGADTMGLVQMSGKRSLRLAYGAYLAKQSLTIQLFRQMICHSYLTI